MSLAQFTRLFGRTDNMNGEVKAKDYGDEFTAALKTGEGNELLRATKEYAAKDFVGVCSLLEGAANQTKEEKIKVSDDVFESLLDVAHTTMTATGGTRPAVTGRLIGALASFAEGNPERMQTAARLYVLADRGYEPITQLHNVTRQYGAEHPLLTEFTTRKASVILEEGPEALKHRAAVVLADLSDSDSNGFAMAVPHIADCPLNGNERQSVYKPQMAAMIKATDPQHISALSQGLDRTIREITRDDPAANNTFYMHLIEQMDAAATTTQPDTLDAVTTLFVENYFRSKPEQQAGMLAQFEQLADTYPDDFGGTVAACVEQTILQISAGAGRHSQAYLNLQTKGISTPAAV